MARKRMIDPGFWIDEKLGTIPVPARLLFMGLISNADDEGRLPGHPALIRSQVFPYDIDITVEQIKEWLKILNGLNIIQIYSMNNQTYIQITNFLKHQTISRPTPSKYPSYESSLNTHGVLIEHSIPIEKNIREKKVKEDKCVFDTPAVKPLRGGAQFNKSKSKTGKGGYTQEFEEFWKAYPRNKEKKAAFKCWNTRLKEKELPENLITAASNYAKECNIKKTEPQYIKLAKTFLGSSKPYEDYIKGTPEPLVTKPKNNKFINFEQKNYDYDELERQALESTRRYLEEQEREKNAV